MSKPVPAILLVADISGYTRFMKHHVVSITHAKQIVVRLLKAIIKASKSPLKVSELEGDAVFFYAVLPEKNPEKVIHQVKDMILQLFNYFYEELGVLRNMRICTCEACRKSGYLKLKQVVHIGEIEIEKIDKSEKLFGLDVIVVHRMLKNSVPSNQYVMMTEYAHTKFMDFYGLEHENFKEDFEGIGETNTVVFYPDAILALSEIEMQRKRSVPLKEKIKWKLKLYKDSGLDLFGLRKIKGEFKSG